ncbi:MAG: arsenate reductase ArsC [Methanobrevibacter sp.]|nr:arsenate reductase ArsC [Methanobrevibacter sp.]
MKDKVLVDNRDNLNDVNKVNVLFICKNNSIRSQMAEAILNSLYNETYIAFSGGINPTNINENTVHVLKEIRIDISNKSSKNLEIFENMKFNHVITVCDDDKCPYFLNTENYINKSFKDPKSSSKSDNLDSFREVRDEIKNWIIEIVENGTI